MSVLLQFCFVIVTIAVAAIAVATIRVLGHFRHASDEFSRLAQETQEWIEQLKRVTTGAEEIVGSVKEVVPRFQSVAQRFEAIGDRAAGVSDALVSEVEAPVRAAVALARGVRYGTAHLIDRLTHRFKGRTTTNGGYGYER